MICWSDWHREPWIVLALLAAAWLYALLTGPWRESIAPGAPYPAAHSLRFYAALAVAYLALGSPLDQLARVFLFSAHMVRDLLLIYPVAALLLLGIPFWLLDPVLGRSFLRRPLGIVLSPTVCGAVFILVVAAWHMPRPFEGALQSPPLAALQDGSMVLAALLFWWPLLGPSRVFPPSGHAVRALYLTCVQVAFTALFSYVFMADHAIYPTYQYAPRLVAALDPLEDQRLAGVLLGVVSSLVLLGALGFGFFRWARHSGGPTAYRKDASRT
jgi:putative membrane protein